ncbi:UNVERIFIED_CONTAM: hypothetical protein GTU68_031930 [Idotea baltica]|nr:hypothetical protein [Idotea baltica]
MAKQLGTGSKAVALGSGDASALESLGQVGIEQVVHIADAGLDKLDAQNYCKAVAEIAASSGAKYVVLSHNYTGRSIASRLGVKLNAGVIAGVIELPVEEGGRQLFKRSCFSGKGYAYVASKSETTVISIAPNSFPVTLGEGTASVEASSVSIDAAKVTVTGEDKITDAIPLSEAELVVSGGRGLRGPENWGMIEEMAEILGAATACSRAVADVDWRPHHEHVGQTGLAISPNLYIAIAISGAIQHLAGVNSSRTIVVINKDPEAPFFKSADYGIVGDAFDVVPKLNEALKKHKASA